MSKPPVSVSFEVPGNCPPDIELMTIWAKSTDMYLKRMNREEIKAAAAWLKSYVDSKADNQQP